MTKYRIFTLKEDITQKDYVTFRAGVEEHRPAVWSSIDDLPIEIFYDILTRSAIKAGWVMDVVETNEYGEETTWVWNAGYIDELPASGKSPIVEWGKKVLGRWVEIKTLDPN